MAYVPAKIFRNDPTILGCERQFVKFVSERAFTDIKTLVSAMLRHQNEKKYRSLLPNQEFYQRVNAALVSGEKAGFIFDIFQEGVNWGHPFNKVTCGRLMQELASAHRFDELMELLQRMEKSVRQNNGQIYQIPLRAEDCTTPLQLLLENNEFEKAKRVLEYLEKFGEDFDRRSKEIIYSVLIRGCAQKENFDDAFYFWTKMEASGLLPTAKIFADFVVPLIKGDHFEEVKSLFLSFISCNLLKDKEHDYLSFEFVQYFSHRGEFALALQAFYHSEDKHPNMFNILIWKLCQNERLRDALPVFERMVKEVIPRENFTYNHLIGALNRAGRVQESLNLLKQMRTDGLVPSALLYSLTLTAHLKQKSFPEALVLEILMGEDGVEISDRIQVGFDTARIKLGRAKEVLERIKNTSSRTLDANKVYFDYLIKCGLEQDAEEVFEITMQREEGDKKEEFCVSAAALYSRTGQEGKLEKLQKRMREKGIPMRDAFYQAMIHGHQNAGRYDKGFQIFRQVQKNGVILSEPSQDLVLRGFFKQGHTAKAISFYEEVTKTSPPSSRFFNTFLEGLFRHQLFNEIERQIEGYQGKIEPSTYKIILKYVENEDLAAEKLDYFESLWAKKEVEGVYFCNLLIKIFSANQRMGSALKVFDEMEERGCQHNVETYNTLLSCYAKQGDFEAIALMSKRMDEKGIEFDSITYNVLIRASYAKEDPDVALTLFEEMVEKGLTPTYTTVTAVIDGEIKNNDPSEVDTLFDLLVQRGDLLDSYLFNRIIIFYSGRKEFDRALSYLQKMKDEGVKYPSIRGDTRTYDRLVAALIHAKEFPQAISLLQDMQRARVLPGPDTKKAFDHLRAKKGHEKLKQLYVGLMKVYVSGGEPGILLDALKDNQVELDLKAMNMLIKGYAFLGISEVAYDLLKQVEAAGGFFIPDRESFHAVLLGFALDDEIDTSLGESSRGRYARRILELMKRHHVEKTLETDLLVLECYYKDRYLERSKEYFANFLQEKLEKRKKIGSDGELQINASGLKTGAAALLMISAIEDKNGPDVIHIYGKTSVDLDRSKENFSIEEGEKLLKEYSWKVSCTRVLDPPHLVIVKEKSH